MTQRQQVLYLWLQGSSLDENVVGWAFHDGTAGTGPGLGESDIDPGSMSDSRAPYRTGVEALVDGWMLLQSAQLIPPAPGQEHVNSYLEYEFVFERRIDLGTPT